METQHEQVMERITFINNLFPFRIQCYSFHLLLKSYFEDAIPLFDGDHVITQINGLLYNSTGVIQKIDRYITFDNYGDSWKDILSSNETQLTFYKYQL